MTDGAPSPIDLNASVNQLFRDAVHETVRDEHFDATDTAAAYVVALLADFAIRGTTQSALQKPFTLSYAEALDAGGPERFERLRTLGDHVLYLNGFFAGYLASRGVAPSYVNSLGARAYFAAGRMLKTSALLSGGDAVTAPDLFAELSENFRMFVELLSHVADRLQANSAHTPTAMLRLYERWLRTGSKELAGALANHGILPKRSDGTVH